jgi:hypothetical protein
MKLSRRILRWVAAKLPGPWFYNYYLATCPFSIECDMCGDKYQSSIPEDFTDNETQGLDCAAFTVEENGIWYIQGSYGSKYDTSRFRLKSWAIPSIYLPAVNGFNPICDNCIREHIEDGSVEEVPGCYL